MARARLGGHEPHRGGRGLGQGDRRLVAARRHARRARLGDLDLRLGHHLGGHLRILLRIVVHHVRIDHDLATVLCVAGAHAEVVDARLGSREPHLPVGPTLDCHVLRRVDVVQFGGRVDHRHLGLRVLEHELGVGLRLAVGRDCLGLGLDHFPGGLRLVALLRLLLVPLQDGPLQFGHVGVELPLHLRPLARQPRLLLSLTEDHVRVAARGEDRGLLGLARPLHLRLPLRALRIRRAHLSRDGRGRFFELHDCHRALVVALAVALGDFVSTLALLGDALSQREHRALVPRARLLELRARLLLADMLRGLGALLCVARAFDYALGRGALACGAPGRGELLHGLLRVSRVLEPLVFASLVRELQQHCVALHLGRTRRRHRAAHRLGLRTLGAERVGEATVCGLLRAYVGLRFAQIRQPLHLRLRLGRAVAQLFVPLALCALVALRDSGRLTGVLGALAQILVVAGDARPVHAILVRFVIVVRGQHAIAVRRLLQQRGGVGGNVGAAGGWHCGFIFWIWVVRLERVEVLLVVEAEKVLACMWRSRHFVNVAPSWALSSTLLLNLNRGQDSRANRTRHTTSSRTQPHAKQQHTNAPQLYSIDDWRDTVAHSCTSKQAKRLRHSRRLYNHFTLSSRSAYPNADFC